MSLHLCDFSPDRKYRYTLWRRWGENGNTPYNYANFVGLNPSTADEEFDDPTIRRCIGFAKDWGLNGICMTNIFAFRATDPKVMLKEKDPVGEHNDGFLTHSAAKANIVIACWGGHGAHQDRGRWVQSLLPGMHCLGLTIRGHPLHPLYLPKTSKLRLL